MPSYRTNPLYSPWSLIAALAVLFASFSAAQPAAAQGACDPLVTIDAPLANATVQDQLAFSGWAVDRSVATGSGISAVQVVSDGLLGAGGTLLGVAKPAMRGDVDAALRRTDSYGFTLTADVSALAPGPHTFAVYATTPCGPAYTSINVNLQHGGGMFHLDTPTAGMSTSNGQMVDIGGWSAGSRVDVYLDGPAGQGLGIGSSLVNKPRMDVAGSTGRAELANSGFDISWLVSGLSNGSHTLYAYSLLDGAWSTIMVQFTGDSSAASLLPTVAAPVAVSVVPSQPITNLQSNCAPGYGTFNSGYPNNTLCNGMNGQYGGSCNPPYPYPNTNTNNGACNNGYNGYNGNCTTPYPYANANNGACNNGYTGFNGACTTPYPYANTNNVNNGACGFGGNGFNGNCTTPYPYANNNNGACGFGTNGFNGACGSTYPYNTGCTGANNGMVGPTSVQAAQMSNGAVTLTWSAANGASSYMVNQSASGAGGPFTTYVTSTSGTTTTISGLATGVTYYFAVSSTSSSGTSAPTPANAVTLS